MAWYARRAWLRRPRRLAPPPPPLPLEDRIRQALGSAKAFGAFDVSFRVPDRNGRPAWVEARGQGLVRFIGVTGHGWTIAAMHLRSLARFDFDSVLLPYNFHMASNARYRQSFDEVLAICRQRRTAVQAIKSIARGPWAISNRTHTTWYQPLEAQADIDRAIHFIMGGLPDVHINTAGDLSVLPRVLDAASRFAGRPSDEAMAAMAGDTRMTSLFGLPA